MARLFVGIGLAILLAASGVATAPGAEAASSAEKRMLANLNDARDNAGLAPFDLDRRLSRLARRHAARMERRGRVGHSDLAGALGAGGTRVAENVGRVREDGLSDRRLAGRLHRAFLRSARHRRNVMGDYDRVGIGIVVADDDDTMWAAIVFSGD